MMHPRRSQAAAGVAWNTQSCWGWIEGLNSFVSESSETIEVELDAQRPGPCKRREQCIITNSAHAPTTS
jgi:hypothetical protein